MGLFGLFGGNHDNSNKNVRFNPEKWNDDIYAGVPIEKMQRRARRGYYDTYNPPFVDRRVLNDGKPVRM